MGDSSCLLPFGNKTMRQQKPAAFEERKRTELRDNCEHLVLNEAQQLYLVLFAAWESDTSSLLEIVLRTVTDEGRPGITWLPHSHLQIQGWQGSSASFNYEWQPFISCLLIRWDDAAALTTFSLLLFWYLQHTLEERISGGDRGQKESS